MTGLSISRLLAQAGWLFATVLTAALAAAEFRPPAVPLVTIDPYTSCWSMTDRLAGDWPRHWTGNVHAMCGLVRVDGKPLRFMGAAPRCADAGRTDLARSAGDANRLSISGGRRRADGHVHFAAAGDRPRTDVAAGQLRHVRCGLGRRQAARGASLFRRHGRMGRQQTRPASRLAAARRPTAWMRCASARVDQRVLATKGDNVRIDWGYFYVAAPKGTARTVIARCRQCRAVHSPRGDGPATADDAQMPRAANDRWPVLSADVRLGQRRRSAGRGGI